jgi:uncharacterized protein
MEIQIQWDVRVPMRDGVILSADIYRPQGDGQYPAIVIRTPYMKATEFTAEQGKEFARNGYAVVYMDVRGRGDSEGEFVPYRNEGEDGYDSIEWTAAQEWCDGNVGTMGGSYLGRIQWLTALTKPPHLKAMISVVTPSDPFVETPTGVPQPYHLCWLFLTSGRMMQNMDAVDWESIYNHLPLHTMDEQVGRDMPHWKEEMEHEGLDEWWQQICYQHRFDEIDLPVLHVSGWYDDEQIGTPLNFHGMRQHAPSEFARENQKLLMGPWGHRVNTTSKLGDIDFGEHSLIDFRGYQMRWLDRYLKNEPNGVDTEPKVKLFVMGVNEWREEADWPLPQTSWEKLYLHSGGQANSRLGDGRADFAAPNLQANESGASDRYTYDPADPYPFISEPTSSQIGGPDDYSELQLRKDVLVYTTEPLTEDLEVTGPLRMDLFAASSAQDTDWCVKLLDVHPDGFAQRLSDGMVRTRFRNGMDTNERIEPGQVYRYDIDCWNTSHVFKKGHRLSVEIASSAFPKYDRHMNTPGPLGMSTEMQVAEQTIFHDAEHPSAMILPVIRKGS